MDATHTNNGYQLACLRLANMRGLSNQHKNILLSHYGDIEDVFATPIEQIKAMLPISAARLRSAFQVGDDSHLKQQRKLLAKHSIDIVLSNASGYPALFRQIDDAPPVLFVRGDIRLLHGPQLAMVGSRNASPSGLKTAQAFAFEFAQSGLTITSGLAQGIDAAAHRGALEEIGRTVAVVATGLDEVYPRSNLSLAKAIVSKGVMISEFPPLTPARRDHFPRRNRLISGLSLGVLVVEADTRSGSLITARLAGEQGREIFAIPGSIHLPTSRGCHQLIRQGAKLVETTADVLLELKTSLTSAIKKPANVQPTVGNEHSFDSDTLTVLKFVDFAPTAIDEIVAHSNLSVDLVSSILLQLELAGQVAIFAGGQYQRLNS